MVVELADNTVNIGARWWISPPGHAETVDSQDMVLTELCNRLVAAGIDLPFPTQQILFHDQTEENGDRARQREGWPSVKGNNPKATSISDSLRKLAKVSISKENDNNNDNVRHG